MGVLPNGIDDVYKGIKYSIDKYITYDEKSTPYSVPCITIDAKIYLKRHLLDLYKKHPLNYNKVNRILGYKVRPCVTNVVVMDKNSDNRQKEYKNTKIRYSIEVDSDEKYLKIDIEHDTHRGDEYIIEKVIMEIIDYITKLKKVIKNDKNRRLEKENKNEQK